MIDVRAEVTCSLGPVISANVSDDYLQGSGVIKTRGNVELQGAFVPAVGTTVTFSWTKPSGTTSLPRELRVLSSTVDPFRLITRVELGCALTYFANRKPPTVNPNSKEENSTAPCYVYNYATLPISASYVLEQCATALGLTLSSNPLTNKFSVEEFDLSAGYVQVIGDLLVSEGYFGIVRSGTLLEVFSLQDDGMTGPIITADDIIDLGPVGVGTLPGETVRVRYTTRRLKVPDPADEQTALKRMWEVEEIIGDQVDTSYTYQLEDGTSVTVNGKYVPYSCSFSVYDGWDRLVYAMTRTVSTASEINARWAGDKRDVGPPVERLSYQRNIYKVPAPPGQLGDFDPLATLQGAGPLAVVGVYAAALDADTGTAADCVPQEKPDDYSDILRSESETWISELELAGSLNIDTYKADDGNVVNFDTIAQVLSSKEVTTYEKDAASGITKTRTERYVAASQTIAGQQDITALLSAGLDTSTGPLLSNSISILLTKARRTRYIGGETRIRTEREYGLQKRPSQSDRNNTSNAKSEPVEAIEEALWAVGSVETEATQEFSLPYAPDDVIGWTLGGGYTSTPSDAKVKALAYGRTQNRLLLGNRYALSLQLDPSNVPDAPFKPLYVQAAGITGQYRVNGCSWAMTKDGVIASTDALYWGAVGADPGATSWVPLPPGMDAADLPATPVTPAVVIPPYSETVIKPLAVRVAGEVQRFGYALEVLTVADPFGPSVGLTVTRPVVATTGTCVITGNAATLLRPRSIVANTGAYAITGNDAPLRGPFRADTGSIAITGNAATLTRKDLSFSSVSLLLHMDGSNGSTTFTDSSSSSITVTASGNAQISTAQSKWGGSSALFDGNGDYISASSNSVFQFGTGDFTIEMWARFSGISDQALYDTIPVGGVGARTTGFVFVLTAAGKLNVFSNNSFRGASSATLSANTWYHIALCRSGNTWTYYVDGSSAGSYTQSIDVTNSTFLCGRTGDAASYYVNGHLDDIRITKGVARYTAGFTVPPMAFPDA